MSYMKIMKIKKGDEVKILSGKDKGRHGQVVWVLPRENKIVVEGLNLFKKHVRSKQAEKKGEMISVAMPLAAAKVMVICKHCAKPTRVACQLSGGKKSRTCKKCGQAL